MSLSPSLARERSLSPWSKIRAMVNAPAGDGTVSKSSSPSVHSQRSAKQGSPVEVRINANDEVSDLSDASDAPRRPVGRIAARLLQQRSPQHGTSSDSDNSDKKISGRSRLLSSQARRGRSPTGHDAAPSTASTPTTTAVMGGSSSISRTKASARSLDSALGSPLVQDSGSDVDMIANQANARFQQLVAKKRAERKAKEEAIQAKAKGIEAQQQNKGRKSVVHSPLNSDSENGRRLTQQSRPARKASKKALEEMHRETQRLARNQQLTHQAKVKKKITTTDLFKLFNYKQEAPERSPDTVNQTEIQESSISLDGSSDVEITASKETPPTSPPTQQDLNMRDARASPKAAKDKYIIHTGIDQAPSDSDSDEPTLEQMLSSARTVDKGKAPVRDVPVAAMTEQQPLLATKRKRKIRVLPPQSVKLARVDKDADDGLEVVGLSKINRFAVFDELPAHKAQEPAALLRLRALAHLKSPGKRPRGQRKAQSNASNIELYMQLQERSRQQALLLRAEKIQELAEKGIHLRTDEEREKEQLEIDNLLEKARDEVLELTRKEKEAARRHGEEGQHFGDSEDEDEDYREDDVDADIELSGSEDEDAASEEEDEEEETAPNPLFDGEAAEDAVEEGDEEPEERSPRQIIESEADLSNEDDTVLAQPLRRRNRQAIISDDEDEVRSQPSAEKSAPRQSPANGHLAAFGFQPPSTSPAGLTQMFMGSLADGESYTAASDSTEHPHGSLDFLRGLEPSTLLGADASPSQGALIPDSQREQQQTHGTALMTPRHSAMPPPTSSTKASQMIEPTQDEGFETSFMILPNPQSTVDTLILPASQHTPSKKRGRLQRRVETIAQLSDDDDNESAASLNMNGDFDVTTSAFDALFMGAKKSAKADNFNKKKSDAKDMVAEQAEESEDEYAGLGGASDEGSDNEFDEDIQEMLDESNVDVKAAALARLHADKQRAEDEKQVDKLYRDITTGLLRRKRAADMDELSDSEDEANERRRRKQLEFARMRKALLEDENIGKIAENPKKMAFLRAIEDRDDDADYINFLEDAQDLVDSVPDSQQEPSATQQSAQANVEEAKEPDAPAITKQKLPAAFEAKENVPPMNHRRSAPDPANKRARTLAEIKEQVSSLLDEPLIPDSQMFDSDSSSDEDNAFQAHRNPRRTGPLSTTRPSVINRLSSNLQDPTDANGAGPMAFHTASSDTTGGFKVPSLLRRSTTNMSAASNGSSGASTPATSTTDSGIRRGGSKKSNIHYQAREAERRKIVLAAETKRKQKVREKVVGTGRGSVLGLLGVKGGGFE